MSYFNGNFGSSNVKYHRSLDYACACAILGIVQRFDDLKFDKRKENEIALFTVLRSERYAKRFRLLAEIFLSLRPSRKGVGPAVRRQCATPWRIYCFDVTDFDSRPRLNCLRLKLLRITRVRFNPWFTSDGTTEGETSDWSRFLIPIPVENRIVNGARVECTLDSCYHGSFRERDANLPLSLRFCFTFEQPIRLLPLPLGDFILGSR